MQFIIYTVVLGICILPICIFGIIHSLKKDNKYEKNGIETDGIVIRTIPRRSAKTVGLGNIKSIEYTGGLYYENFVKYIGDDDKSHEALITNCSYKSIEYNMHIRILYIPGKYDKCIGFDL